MDYGYREDLLVNLNALHKEWLRQPLLFMFYSEKSAKAREEIDDAKKYLDIKKADLKRIAANLDLKIRSNKELQKSIGKVTDTAINNWVITRKDYEEGEDEINKAIDKLNKAKYKDTIYSAAVEAFRQRKSGLENSVKLRLAEYFCEPVESSEIFDWNPKEERRKKIVDKQRKGINK